MAKGNVIEPWNRFSGEELRRSSRVAWELPILVYGQDRQGEKFVEETEVTDLSLHGCGYFSRHECLPGSFVTLRFGGERSPGHDKFVRAQVKRIQTGAGSRSIHLVGVELGIPGNVWSVSPMPLDWRRILSTDPYAESNLTSTLPNPSSVTWDVPQKSQHHIPSEPPRSVGAALAALRSAEAIRIKAEERLQPPSPVLVPEPEVSPESENAQKWMEDTIDIVLRERLEGEVARARSSFDEQARSFMDELQEVMGQEKEALVRCSQELLPGIDNRLDEVRARWEAQIEGLRVRTEEMVGKIEEQVRTTQRDLAVAKELADRSLGGIVQRIEEKMTEAVERGAQLMEQRALQSANRHLIRLGENARVVTREACSLVTANSAAARAELQESVRTILEEFRRQAGVHASLIAADTTEQVTSRLTALDAEHRSNCEARKKAIQNEVDQAGSRVNEDFQQGLRTFLYSCLAAAAGAVEQHSKITREGLTPNLSKPPLSEP